jgi:endonuclease/exonuclease/phosphatase family metal-dependent hydrolase
MITKGCVVVCGDFNAHSPWWNSGCSQGRNARCLENLVQQHDLEIIHYGQMTRVTWKENELIKSITDFTLVRGAEVKNASARSMTDNEEDLRSDH